MAALLTGAVIAAPITVVVTQETQLQAGGNIPDMAIPTSLSPNAIDGLKLVNFLDNLELNFFAAGYTNMTVRNSNEWSTAGYPSNLNISATTKKMVAQELVHIASVETLLLSADQKTLNSCQYRFPVSTVQEFFAIGDTIINLGISATRGLAQGVAASDPALIAATSSMLAVKSRYSAFLRIAGNLSPNPTPFDAAISATWAFNLALRYVVPGSCSFLPALPILPTLGVTGTTNISISLTWDPKQTPVSTAVANRQPIYIAWVNQLNVPIYTPLTIVAPGTGISPRPAGLEGVSFIAMTGSTDPRSSIDLLGATLAGPMSFNS